MSNHSAKANQPTTTTKTRICRPWSLHDICNAVICNHMRLDVTGAGEVTNWLQCCSMTLTTCHTRQDTTEQSRTNIGTIAPLTKLDKRLIIVRLASLVANCTHVFIMLRFFFLIIIEFTCSCIIEGGLLGGGRVVGRSGAERTAGRRQKRDDSGQMSMRGVCFGLHVLSL